MTDEELIAGTGQRDEKAFLALYARHAPEVYGLLLRLTGGSFDSGEILRDTWLHAVRQLSLFRGQSTFDEWLRGIALHAYRERRRRHTREFSPDDAIREVLVLHDGQGYTIQAVADALEIDLAAVHSRLSRGHEAGRDLPSLPMDTAVLPPAIEAETVTLLRDRGLLRRQRPWSAWTARILR